MSRPLRIEFPGAFFHVTSRGNARKDIFTCDEDRQQFLFLLSKTIKKFNWLCHSFVLMDNHYHLCIETTDPTFSRGMRHLNGLFTQWHNAQHHSVGHILQGRFKAFLIEEESYLLNVVRYIVLNPVRAGMVSDPAVYQWSSYRALAGLERASDWLTLDNILGRFGKERNEAQHGYRDYVLEGIGLPSPFDELQARTILGTDQFVDEQKERLERQQTVKDILTLERMAGRPVLQEVFDDLKTIDKRNASIALALNHLLYSGSEVGRYLNLDASTIRKIAKQYK